MYGGEEAERGQAAVEKPADVEPPLRVVVRPRLPVQHVREQHAQQQHVDVAPQLRVGGMGRGAVRRGHAVQDERLATKRVVSSKFILKNNIIFSKFDLAS